MHIRKNPTTLIIALSLIITIPLFSMVRPSSVAHHCFAIIIAATDSTPGAYGALLADANSNILIHAHTIKYITDRERTNIDLSKALLIVNGEKIDDSTLQQQDLYGDELTVYSSDDAAMLCKYGDSAKNGVAVLTNAFYEPKNRVLRTQPDTTEDKVFTALEHHPSFPGGEGAWINYMRKHISDNLDALISSGSTGTCRVRFIVDVDGTVSEVQALTMKDSKLAQVAVDAIRQGPKWLPGRQNGRLVKAYAEQPITFNVAH